MKGFLNMIDDWGTEWTRFSGAIYESYMQDLKDRKE
jgi:hypothetical protein